MRISNLTGVSESHLTQMAEAVGRARCRAYVTTTELAAMLGVSTDTVKRRLNRERQRFADDDQRAVPYKVGWDESTLPPPANDKWRTRPAEWNLITVLRWLAARPMQRRV